MTEHLSILGLISHASIPVQLVMLSLIAASVYSWSLIVKYRRVHRRAMRDLKNFEELFWSGADLSQHCVHRPLCGFIWYRVGYYDLIYWFS